MKNENIFKIAFSGISVSLALILPFLTGQIPEIGAMLSPMHIPIFICGMICGYKYGLIVGLISPIIRFLFFGMPPIYPTGISMSLELGTYGLISGFLFSFLKKRKIKLILNIYISLIISMMIGRIIMGLSHFVIGIFDIQNVYTFKVFIMAAFINAWPGLILHLILVPSIVVTLNKTLLLKQKV